MAFSGTEVTRKGFPQGWSEAADDQDAQRVLRVTQLLESYVLHSWSWDRFNSAGLRYRFHGGVVSDGTQWIVVAGGSVTLADDIRNYVERSALGVVSVNQTGFTPALIPMAEVVTKNGRIITRGYTDRRPFSSAAGAGGGGGATTFTQLIGQILDSQMTLSAVKQFEGSLAIAFTQLTGSIANGQVPASAVVQHEAALTIDVSQITGLYPIQAADLDVSLTDLLDWLVSRAASPAPQTTWERLYASENYT